MTHEDTARIGPPTAGTGARPEARFVALVGMWRTESDTPFFMLMSKVRTKGG
jgi:hypothetical protein